MFSTKAAPLKAEKSYNLFQTYAWLECKGNFPRAALRLSEAGYTADGADEDPVDEPPETKPLPCRPLL